MGAERLDAASAADILGERFDETYRRAGTDVLLDIERQVFASDYGASSWTTRDEADAVGTMLALGPGKRFLEVGTGCGWPGLYLARTTGCDAALIDLPMAGLTAAARRATEDGIAARCILAMADGAALPFPARRFDAVTHSDVLCCLHAKQAVLGECRRVAADTGALVFSVLHIAPGLSAADHRRALASGPAFIDTDMDYGDLLHRTGWSVVARRDLTERFATSLGETLRLEESHAAALTAVLGAEAFAERIARRRNRLAGVEAGLIRRELLHATPAP